MSKVGERELRRIWWAFYWRTSVLGAIAGFVLGIVGGVVAGMLGFPGMTGAVGMALGLIANAVVSYFMLRVALEKRYQGFSVTVGPDQLSAFD